MVCGLRKEILFMEFDAEIDVVFSGYGICANWNQGHRHGSFGVDDLCGGGECGFSGT
jgi:hypothetical protein